MKNYLSYEEVATICKQINDKFMPDEESFINKIDQIFEENSEQTPQSIVEHGFVDLLAHVDSAIKEIESKANISPSCEIGCAFCCYFPIIVSRLEVKLMLEYIDMLPAERKNTVNNHLKRYFKDNKEKVDTACSLNFEENDSFKLEYIKEQLACPFLDKASNSCLVYEVRPLPCRTYLNYSNPKVCEQSYVPKEPFSYEFLQGFYFESLNEIMQEFYYEGIQLEGISYPDDAFEINYLPKLLKEQLLLEK
jgi:Fe-S-cluster containining protein